MKSRPRFFLWIIRIVGVFILTIGMYSPALAVDFPDLSVTKTNVGGDFAQADQNRTYTITVSNGGIVPTDGTMITLTDTIPAGIIPQTISGDSGWTCPTGDITASTSLTCTRTAPLAAGASSVITLVVDVAVNAGSGPLIDEDPIFLRTVSNSVNVTGAGDQDASNISNSFTRIIQKPDLRVIGWELRNAANTAVITSVDPDQSFWIRMTIENRGGLDTGSFYPGVFLDNKPNYGKDHDEPGASPVPLNLGEITSFSGYHLTPAGVNQKGCMYYDPSNLIDEVNQAVNAERGNYTRPDFIPDLTAGTSTTADVFIAYPQANPYNYIDPIYDSDNVRTGLKAGNYNIYLYADPNCVVANESYEDNNSYGPIPLNVGGGFPSGPTTINVTIAGTSMGNYPMVPETSQVLKYLVDGGPVVIGNNDGIGIIASLNQWRRNAAQPETWFTGVAQSMALPVEQITNRYVMPRYNGTNPTLYDAVLMANVDTVPRTITVTIGGTVMGTYPLNPSQSVYATYPIVGGPIVVSSVTGARIVASLYELKRSQAGVPWNGQSEMMGLPSGQLSDKYLLPIYFGAANPATLDARLYFANVDTVATTVEVKIAGVSRGTYLMQPSTSMEVKYLVDGGPVEISSNNGAKIVASLNQWRRNAAEPVEWFTGVAQSMALPVELITDKYVIPRYNGTDPTLYDAVLMANVDSVPRTITVKIGATVMGTYPLNPSASVYATYPIADGPIIVSSDVGAKIVASLYELKRSQAGVPWNGQSEMMGLPFGQLSDQYLLPIYFGAANPATLDARLYIAVP